MRHGELTVVRAVSRVETATGEGNKPFLLVVADDDGTFSVIGSEWVQERWAGAALVEPTADRHWRTVESLMLREAERRRHGGVFDEAHPMLLENEP